MVLENRFVGSQYNDLGEYFCELTEILDNITEEKRLSRRHYILAKPCNLRDGVLPIRLPGCTVGGIFLDDNKVIARIKIDGNYYRDIYPGDINEILKNYVGEKIIIEYD